MDFEPNEHVADGVTAGQARHNSSNVGGVTVSLGATWDTTLVGLTNTTDVISKNVNFLILL